MIHFTCEVCGGKMQPFSGGRFEWQMKTDGGLEAADGKRTREDGMFIVNFCITRNDTTRPFDICVECLRSVIQNGKPVLDYAPTRNLLRPKS